MRTKNAFRDQTHHMIHEVRQGRIQQLFPDELQFSISFNGSPIANFIDIVARDMADGIGPLPTLACVSGRMKTDADLERAERKNKIGWNYWESSRLAIEMLKCADRYITYGYAVAIIEPNQNAKLPFINLVDPRHCYYELDRFNQVKTFARRFTKTADELVAQFPEYRSVIVQPAKPGRPPISGETRLEVVQYIDSTTVLLMLPEREGCVLGSYQHKLSRPPVRIALRPGESDDPRGQFDDVIWVQVARSIMSTLALEAASIAVQAPISVPDDMDELPVGPNAILQSQNPDKIRRLNLELPTQIFAEGQILDQELKTGSRYPDARTGGVQASVITGKGIEALLGTFDAQIKSAQIVMKEFLEGVTSLCFEMDEVWWPSESKTVSGITSGASYEFDYTAKKDINGRWNCIVTYGFAAGMQPAQSYITLLQLEGAGLIARSTTQENLPFAIDPVQEQRKISVEGWREALKQGMFAWIQASGQVAEQGGDPTEMFNLAVAVIRQIQNGVPEEEAVSAAYSQLQAARQAQQQAQEQAAQAAQAAQAGPGGAGPGGMDINGSSGLPTGVAPGQAGLPPGGLPTIQRLISGFRGNASIPVNEATVQRRIPTGT